MHDPLHRLFGNGTPQEQIKQLLFINSKALTNEFTQDILIYYKKKTLIIITKMASILRSNFIMFILKCQKKSLTYKRDWWQDRALYQRPQPKYVKATTKYAPFKTQAPDQNKKWKTLKGSTRLSMILLRRRRMIKLDKIIDQMTL